MSSSPELPVLSPAALQRWDDELHADDLAYAAAYPGPAGPGCVHTVYVPVPQFGKDVIARWGSLARTAVETHPEQWRAVLGTYPDAGDLSALTLAKLASEPIED